jgi:hypothetical protein
MPTGEQIKQFLTTAILPLIVGAATTWLAGTKVLSVFDIPVTAVSGALTGLGVFLIGAAVTWLSAHHILSAHYTPAAKAAARRPSV